MDILPEDIIRIEIAKYLDIKSKSRLQRCSKLLYKIIKVNDVPSQERRKRRLVKLKYNNELLKLLLEYGDYSDDKNWATKNWSIRSISANPNITLDIVRKYPEGIGKIGPWDYEALSANPNITWEMILENPDIFNLSNIDRHWLSCNPNLTLEIIKNNIDLPGYPEKFRINWEYFSFGFNPNITWKEIQDNPEIFNKYWYGLGANPNITWDIILDTSKKLERKWSWARVSSNPNINIKIIKDNIDYPNTIGQFWSWEDISKHINITWEDIQNNPDIPWSVRTIGANPNVTWDIISKNSGPFANTAVDNQSVDNRQVGNNQLVDNRRIEEWDWSEVSRNPNLTSDIIKQHLKSPNYSKKNRWHWDGISMNTFGN